MQVTAVIDKLFNTLRSFSKIQILAVGLIVLGVVLVVFFGLRSFRSFREMQYIREQGLDLGTADVNAIRPWMTIRFVAVAYAVPQEYLFAELDIPFERRNSHDTLHQLNRKYEFGRPTAAHEPPILNEVRDAILKYRANPVATGLKGDVRPWMSIRYIANSTGIPEEHIFEQLDLPAAGNENKPLDRLAEEFRYAGGRRALVEGIKAALANYGGNQ